MGPMCRYSYSSGACANRRVESINCIGEEACKFSDSGYDSPIPGQDSRYDVGSDRWLSLYCDTHGRFLCERGDDCSPLRPRTGNVAYKQRRILDDGGAGTW